MFRAFLVIGLLGLVSCASGPKTGDEQTDALITHMGKGPTVVGKDWDPKFFKDGFINGEFVAIGSASSRNTDHLENPLGTHAESQATARLLRSAPSEYKKIVQRVLNTLDGDEGSTQEAQIHITEVKALTGMKSNFDDRQCVTTATPNQDMKYTFTKECRVIVRISASKLAEAYDYTLGIKYRIERKNDIQKMINDELMGRGPASVAATPADASVPTNGSVLPKQ